MGCARQGEQAIDFERALMGQVGKEMARRLLAKHAVIRNHDTKSLTFLG